MTKRKKPAADVRERLCDIQRHWFGQLVRHGSGADDYYTMVTVAFLDSAMARHYIEVLTAALGVEVHEKGGTYCGLWTFEATDQSAHVVLIRDACAAYSRAFPWINEDVAPPREYKGKGGGVPS